jgi:serpin B
VSDLPFEHATAAVNSLGVDLYGALAASARKFVVSPMSIQLAMAMTTMGASGETAAEMRRVLRLGGDAIDELTRLARSLARDEKDLRLDIANRLFVQRAFDLRPAFVETVAKGWGAAPESLDFADGESARQKINAWVLGATHEKIRDLVPAGLIDAATRLVLANALYLRAAWQEPFPPAEMTRDEDFFVDGSPVKVPTMASKVACGQASLHGARVVTLPFEGGLQFVAIVPKRIEGLGDLAHLPVWLDRAARLTHEDAIVYLPKFRIEPPALALSDTLRALGLATTFDDPPGSANFEAMAPRTPEAYLFVAEVLHKSFIAIDESGVEAAAATAVMMALGGAAPRKSPPVIRVDRPFIFAVQHAPSGACPFLGRVTDPR